MAPTQIHNLTFIARDGNSYASPVRLGRPDKAWDSNSLIASVFGILVKERLGIDVVYVSNPDEIVTFQALLGCLDWMTYFSLEGLPCVPAPTLQAAQEAVNARRKVFADPLPDIFISLEQWPTPMLNRSTRSVEPLHDYGSIGFVSEYALWVKLATCKTAWDTGRVVLRDYHAYREPATASYFTKLSIIVVDPDIIGASWILRYCPGNLLNSWDVATLDYSAKYIEQQGFSCNDSLGGGVALWRSTACAALGDNWTTDCTPVILAPTIPACGPILLGVNISEAKMVLLTVTDWGKVSLLLDKYDMVWLWWSTDAQHYHRRPEVLRLDDSTEHSTSSNTVPLKTVWSPSLRSSRSLQILLQQFLIDIEELNTMLTLLVQAKDAGHGPSNIEQPYFFTKIACDWMRNNTEFWEGFLPNSKYCEDGQFFDDVLVGCTSCPPGTRWIFSGSQGSCVPCPPGTTQSEAGQSACLPCISGTASNATGLRAKPFECPRCDIGYYSDMEGSTTCKSCDPKKNTISPGSTKKEDCHCMKGWHSSALFRETAASSSVCTRCDSTMVCHFGLEYPQVLPGYYTFPIDPLSIFKCSLDPEKSSCLGGPLGNTACSGLRHGFLCAMCPEGSIAAGNSECIKCSQGDRMSVAFLLIAFVVACGLLVLWSHRSSVRNNPAMLSAACFFSQLLTCLQLFSAIATTKIRWGEPLDSIQRRILVFSLNLNDVVNLACVDFQDPAANYGARMIGPMVLCLFAFLLVFVLQCAFTRICVAFEDVVNVIGQFLLAVYISIALASLLPYHCYQHPNGSFSLVSDPSILCSLDGTYSNIIAISAVSFLVYVVGTLALVLYAVVRYPIEIIKDDVKFLRMYHFLFFRVTPRYYYFAAVWLIRNFFIALLPMVISPEEAFVALYIIIVIFLISLALTASSRPWRSESMNLADVFLHIPLSAFMVATAMDSAARPMSFGFTVLLTFFLVGTVVSLVALFLWSLVETLFVQAYVDFFLSHHKVGGACMARYLKVILSQHRRSVFLDSDNLFQLGHLLDAVKKSRVFLLLLSGEVLSRPWCGGEIVTAHQCGIPFACCVSDVGRKATTPQVLLARDFDQYYNLSGAAVTEFFRDFILLVPYGIIVKHLTSAYDFLSKQEVLYFELQDHSRIIQECQNILKMGRRPCTCSTWTYMAGVDSSVSFRNLNKIPPTSILCDPKDREAIASARFIAVFLRHLTQQEISLSPCFSDNFYERHIAILVVCMGARVIHDVGFLILLERVFSHFPTIGLIPVRISDTFTYPDSDYYKNLGTTFDVHSADINLSSIVTCLQILFETIAVPINVGYATQRVLDASVKGLLRRIRGHQVLSDPVSPRLSAKGTIMSI